MPQIEPRAKPTKRGPTQPAESLGTTLADAMAGFSADPSYWTNLAKVALGKFEPTEPDSLPTPEPCPTCHGARWIALPSTSRDDPNFGQTKPCPTCADADFGQRSLTRKLKLAGVPELFAPWDFATYRAVAGADQIACTFVEHWATSGSGSLLLLGPVGAGKTGLAIPAFRQRIASGQARTHSYLRTVDLFRRLYATMRNGAEQSEAEVIDAVSECGLLLLDDLGAEKASAYVETKFYEIIGTRHDERRDTIFTSNLALDELRDSLGERTYDRVLEMCAGGTFAVDGNRGKSIRRRGNAP